MNERIQALIAHLKIQKSEFARRLNLSEPYISELCSGKTTPSNPIVSNICREFHVNESWLRSGEGEMLERTENTILEQLCSELNADEIDKKIIQAYFKIDPNTRKQFFGQLIQGILPPYRTPEGFIEASGGSSETTGPNTMETSAKSAFLSEPEAGLSGNRFDLEEDPSALRQSNIA